MDFAARPLVRPGGDRADHRSCEGPERRRDSERDRYDHQYRHQYQLRDQDAGRRELRVHPAAGGQLSGDRGADRVQARRARGHCAADPADRPGRYRHGGRTGHAGGTGHRRGAAADRERGHAGPGDRQPQSGRPAAERARLRATGAAFERDGPGGAGRAHGRIFGQRHALDAKQLPARRRGQQQRADRLPGAARAKP